VWISADEVEEEAADESSGGISGVVGGIEPARALSCGFSRMAVGESWNLQVAISN